MNVELVSSGIPELLPLVRTGDPTHHVSMIIRYLCIKLGHFESDEERGGPSITRMEMGNAFEDALVAGLAMRYVKRWPHRYVRPGEIELDGLIGTPDLLDLMHEAVDEIKLTWISSRHADDPECEKFWKYWVQLQAYLKMMGWKTGHLHICFVNGNYKDKRDPVYHVYRAEFTQRELDDNWRMLVSNGQVMRAEMGRA